MGYHTDFTGRVDIVPPLNAVEVAYLQAFNRTRHNLAGVSVHAVEQPSVGPRMLRLSDEPHPGKPGYYCPWTVCDDGTALVWDGTEKPYEPVEWMRYVVGTFLAPPSSEFPHHPRLCLPIGGPPFDQFTFDHVCNGEFEAQGEEPGDHWHLLVADNEVRRLDCTRAPM